MFAVRSFTNGGFVVHGITGACAGKASAWFSTGGKLANAERIDSKGRCYPIKPDSSAWGIIQHCASLYGRIADLQSNGEG